MIESVNNQTTDFLKKLDDNKIKMNLEKEQARKTIDQKDFFAILTKELSQQDPLKPVDNKDLVTQMTAFKTSQGIDNIDENFKALNTSMQFSNSLSASALVGKQVLIPSNKANLNQHGIKGVFFLDNMSDQGNIEIRNAQGSVIKNIELKRDGQNNRIEFKWDGTNNEGITMPIGTYYFNASQNIGNQNSEAIINLEHKISSVKLSDDNRNIFVNIDELGTIPLSKVTEIASK